MFEVVTAIVSRPQATPAQLKKLQSLVVALLDKSKRPRSLLIGLAQIQSALDRPQDSENIYRELLRKNPRDEVACNNLSTLLALQKTKLDEALELIDRAIESAGPQGWLLDTRAVVLIARGEPQRALEDLESALAEKVTPLRLFHKAWACSDLGLDDKAKEALRAAKNAGFELSMLTPRNAKSSSRSPPKANDLPPAYRPGIRNFARFETVRSYSAAQSIAAERRHGIADRRQRQVTCRRRIGRVFETSRGLKRYDRVQPREA